MGAAARHNLLEFCEVFLFLLVAMIFIGTLEDLGVFAAAREVLLERQLDLSTTFWITGAHPSFPPLPPLLHLTTNHWSIPTWPPKAIPHHHGQPLYTSRLTPRSFEFRVGAVPSLRCYSHYRKSLRGVGGAARNTIDGALHFPLCGQGHRYA